MILSLHPDIDIERFKLATDKKVILILSHIPTILKFQIITVEELKMLFQIYGLAEHIQDIEQRIIDCFLTHNREFW